MKVLNSKNNAYVIDGSTYLCNENKYSDDVLNERRNFISRKFRGWREWHRKERGDSFGDHHAPIDPRVFLFERNQSFHELLEFYNNDLIILLKNYEEIPHPVLGGKLSPKKWERRGNLYMTSPHKLSHDIEQLDYLGICLLMKWHANQKHCSAFLEIRII